MFGKGAIILVIGFGIIFGLIGIRLNSLENRAIGNMAYYFDINQSHNLAVAGANVGISKVYQDPSLRGVITNQTFSSGLFKGGAVTVRVDSLNISTLRLRSVSTFKNYSDTVEVFFSKQRFQSFSMFAWMTNFEGNVFWITGDTVWGRVHSNGNIHISGSPVFMEKLTTAKHIDPKPGNGQSKAIYKKGYETGIAPIQFPTDLSELIAASTSGGKRYTTNIWITLNPGSSSNNDGKAYIRTSATGPIIDSISLNDPSFNGVIYSTQRVTVSGGQLDGKLTIASGTNIYIDDDVIYERNPLINPTSDDLLGLVANGNVVVTDNTANRNNCEIHAAIFSRSGSFTAENYNTRPISGYLKIIGGIVQDTRGAVGTFNTGTNTLKTGFSKRYYFDPRLADVNTRPPYFPGYYRKTLAIVNWWENVRIPQF